MLAYSLHSIHLKRDGKVVVQEPKAVFECASEKQYDELKALGSVREPTDAERALYGLANPAAPAPAAPNTETKVERRAREKAEAAAAAAAQAADDAAALEAAAAAQVAALEAAADAQAAADANGPTIE